MSDVRILILSPNWLGDSVMAMPALQALRDEYVDAHLAVLTKGHLAALWGMHAAPDELISLDPGNAGMFSAITKVKEGSFDRAFILPNSFRSGLIPYAARIPVRIGMKGHSRALMLTDICEAPRSDSQRHQMWEYFSIAGVAPDAGVGFKGPLTVPRSAVDSVQRLGLSSQDRPRFALMPGAAYGASKRWPVEYFRELAQSLVEQSDGEIVLLGTRAEAESCASISDLLPNNALNLAGRTSLQELAAALVACSVCIANDSGGMHLAAAVGTPVVGIYGITDPEKTGPLGEPNRIIFDPDIQRSRDLERHSSAAESALRAISPARVLQAVDELTNSVAPR